MSVVCAGRGSRVPDPGPRPPDHQGCWRFLPAVPQVFSPCRRYRRLIQVCFNKGNVVVMLKVRRKERGANLVEFALIAPLLIMLVMGIIDFGWILSTQQDVRHGAREAARLAAVNAGTTAVMTTSVCGAMNISSGATVTFNNGGGAIGSTGSIVLVSPVTSLTGFASLPFADSIYPTAFTESVTFRLEQPATWTNGSGVCP